MRSSPAATPDSPPRAGRLGTIVSRHGWRTPFVAAYRLSAFRDLLCAAWIRLTVQLLCDARIHPSVRFGRRVRITKPGGDIRIGAKTYVGDGCRIEVGISPKGHLTVGEDVYLAPGVLVASAGVVTIGDRVLVGEYTSIRDTTHRHGARGLRIRDQGDRHGTIIIGPDAWVGRGCLLIGREGAGLQIGEGAVIAANSVVKIDVPPYAIAGGAPARIIGHRTGR